MSLDVPAHPYDARVSKLVDGPRLLQEAVEAPAKDVPSLGGRHHAHVVCPHGNGDGEVLLERYPSVQHLVERQVGNAEAARAEHADNLVLVDPGAGRQGVAHDADSTTVDWICWEHVIR